MIFFFLSLAGLYAQDCQQGLRRSQDFRGEQVTYSEENFFDAACGSPSLVTRSYGTYGLGGDLPALGAREMDFVFEKVTLEPKTEVVAKLYRERRLCGREDWAVDQAREITGLSCDFFGTSEPLRIPAAGEKRFGIVAETGVSLRFGRLSPDFDGRTPRTRPASLDPLPYFRQSN